MANDTEWIIELYKEYFICFLKKKISMSDEFIKNHMNIFYKSKDCKLANVFFFFNFFEFLHF